MKRLTEVELTFCDACGKQSWVTTCLACHADHCWECEKVLGVLYQHGVYASGSGDGYYCAACDARLTREGTDPQHRAYRVVRALKDEAKAWGADFERRTKIAEARVQACLGRAKEATT